MFRYLAVTLITALILTGLIPYKTVDAEIPMERYISYMENFIQLLETHIEENGIILPEDLQDNLEEAKSLLQQARDAPESEAIELLIRAGILIAPVAKYVIQEGVEVDVDRRALEDAIKIRLEMIDKALNTLNQLIEMGVICDDVAGMDTVSRVTCIELDVESLRTTLLEARDELQNILENLDSLPPEEAAERIRLVDEMVREALLDIREAVKRSYPEIGFRNAVGFIVTGFMYKLADYINRTIEYIKIGEIDRALTELRALSDVLDALIQRLERVGSLADKVGVPEKVKQGASDTLAVLKALKEKIDLAIQALENGDVDAAINYLEQAINLLDENVDKLSIPVPGMTMDIRERIFELKVKIETVRNVRAGLMNRVFEQIAERLDNIEARIDQLEAQYKSGVLPRSQYISQLNMIKIELITIKNLLEKYPGAPLDLIKRVDSLIERVDQLIASA